MTYFDQKICAWGGPFAWNGLPAFWVAAGAFFAWLMVMSWLTLKAIADEARSAGTL